MRGADGDEGDDAHHDVGTVPARKLEELRRHVEAEERQAEAGVEERADDDKKLRCREGGDDGHGTQPRSMPPTRRSCSGISCFTKKLRRLLCNVAKA